MESEKMAEILVYVLVIFFLLTLLIAKIIGQRFFNRSLNQKKIDPSDERRSLWRFVAIISGSGLFSGLSISIGKMMNPIASQSIPELMISTILATIGFSIFAFVAFWMIGAALRARIMIEIQKETKNSKIK